MFAFLLAILWSWDRVTLDCAGRQETVASYSLTTSIKTPQFMTCADCACRCVSSYFTTPWTEQATVPQPATGTTVNAPDGFDIPNPTGLDQVIFLLVVAVDQAGNRSTDACP